MALSLAIGVLTAGGLYLILQRELVRIVFGFLLLSHAANLLLISAGVASYRVTPLLGTGETAQMADPLPQAFVLTSIVITVATAIYMLALAITGQRTEHPHDADRTDALDEDATPEVQDSEDAHIDDEQDADTSDIEAEKAGGDHAPGSRAAGPG